MQVAKLAGVPGPVVVRARQVLERLEKEAAGPANLDDLPLFAAVAEPEAKYGPSPAEEALRANVTLEEGAGIATVTLAQLAKTIPSESRDEFKPLFDLLGKLKGVTVFKVGEVNVAVYVVGKAADGTFAGIKTEVVET